MNKGPIGVFDSGYGGLTVLKSLTEALSDYDFIYLGDNARAPYGTRSFESVYEYTRQCVEWFFKQGCPLVILACNTASAKALRTIQQNYLPSFYPERRVLGVIRPTTEVIGNYSKSGNVGILATPGTVQSCSYPVEISKFFPEIKVYQQACPMWVPLIENNEIDNAGSDYFVKACVDDLLAQNNDIDVVLLGCTHYPLLENRIKKYLPENIRVVSQGDIVAGSLKDYLLRHQEMESRLSKTGKRNFYTTDSSVDFDKHAALFYGSRVISEKISLRETSF
ncbi:MAG: glutamate racemase [Bacteroidota bacterium]|jgi:glutamate racemase